MLSLRDNWDKVFKNGLSKVCGRQSLKNLKGYGLLLWWSSTWLTPTQNLYDRHFQRSILQAWFWLYFLWIFCIFFVFFYIFCIFFVSTYEKKVYHNSIQSKNIKIFFLSLHGFIFADRYVRGFLIISYGKFGLNSPNLKLKAVTEYPTVNEENEAKTLSRIKHRARETAFILSEMFEMPIHRTHQKYNSWFPKKQPRLRVVFFSYWF